MAKKEVPRLRGVRPGQRSSPACSASRINLSAGEPPAARRRLRPLLVVVEYSRRAERISPSPSRVVRSDRPSLVMKYRLRRASCSSSRRSSQPPSTRIVSASWAARRLQPNAACSASRSRGESAPSRAATNRRTTGKSSLTMPTAVAIAVPRFLDRRRRVESSTRRAPDRRSPGHNEQPLTLPPACSQAC